MSTENKDVVLELPKARRPSMSQTMASVSGNDSLVGTRKWKDQVHRFGNSQDLQSFYSLDSSDPQQSKGGRAHRGSSKIAWKRPGNQDQVIKEGIMEVPSAWKTYQSDSRASKTTWESRYFILYSNLLYYCGAAEETKPLGIIMLADSQLINTVDATEVIAKNHKNCFKLVAPVSYTDFGKKEWKDATYVFCCNSSSEVEEWITALKPFCNVSDPSSRRRLSVSVTGFKNGYLEKMGRGKKWKLRWFEVQGGKLSKYETKDGKLMDSFPLATCELSEYQPEKFPCTFEVIAEGKSIILKADSDIEMHSWLNNILYAKTLQNSSPQQLASLLLPSQLPRPISPKLEPVRAISPKLEIGTAPPIEMHSIANDDSKPSWLLDLPNPKPEPPKPDPIPKSTPVGLPVTKETTSPVVSPTGRPPVRPPRPSTLDQPLESRMRLEKKLESYLKLKERALERSDMEGVSLYDAKIDEVKNMIALSVEQKETIQRAEMEQTIQTLQQQKKQAVEKEDYETAKQLKLRIQELTTKLAQLDSLAPPSRKSQITAPLTPQMAEQIAADLTPVHNRSDSASSTSSVDFDLPFKPKPPPKHAKPPPPSTPPPAHRLRGSSDADMIRLRHSLDQDLPFDVKPTKARPSSTYGGIIPPPRPARPPTLMLSRDAMKEKPSISSQPQASAFSPTRSPISNSPNRSPTMQFGSSPELPTTPNAERNESTVNVKDMIQTLNSTASDSPPRPQFGTLGKKYQSQPEGLDDLPVRLAPPAVPGVRRPIPTIPKSSSMPNATTKQ